MAIRSSLKKKSILALTIYLAFFLAIVGTLSYWGLEVPFRKELKNNLALRAELLATQIREPLNNSIGFCRVLPALAKAQPIRKSKSACCAHYFLLLAE